MLFLTCPHKRLPRPRKTHHSHCSMVRLTQLNGFPPNCTMRIYMRKERESSIILHNESEQVWWLPWGIWPWILHSVFVLSATRSVSDLLCRTWRLSLTCMIKVPSMMEQKMGLLNMPSKTFLSPWILRALSSLKICMRTKVLKTMV